MADWTINDIPSQAGRLAVVTGTGGLGYETALALAGAGAAVIVAGRSETKGQDALRRIRAQHPHAAVSFAALDLASLDSVAAFAETFAAAHRRLDLLINNAGVMALPERQETADSFEMQLGTNYLGHFALTGHLLPLLLRGEQPRVISLSSNLHRQGQIDLSDLQSVRRYRAWPVYGQSKLAMLLFAAELQRRSDAHGWGLLSVAAHPGWAHTELVANGPGAEGISARIMGLVTPLLAQSAAAGALPTLMAATAPGIEGGAYYGPLGLGNMRGAPGLNIPGAARPERRSGRAPLGCLRGADRREVRRAGRGLNRFWNHPPTRMRSAPLSTSTTGRSSFGRA